MIGNLENMFLADWKRQDATGQSKSRGTTYFDRNNSMRATHLRITADFTNESHRKSHLNIIIFFFLLQGKVMVIAKGSFARKTVLRPHTYNDENRLSIICINASIENEK
jgi:hypothetical protein